MQISVLLPQIQKGTNKTLGFIFAGGSNFPWNVSLSELSVWTLCNGDHKYLLKPVTTKCTIGLSTRFANSNKDSITSLGLCIHNDTGALHISVNQAQVL